MSEAAPASHPAEPEPEIHVVRTGGFTGIERRGSVRLAALDRTVADALRAQFADAAADSAGVTPGRPDRFAYELSWGRDGDRRVVRLAEHQLAPPLRAALDACLRTANG